MDYSDQILGSNITGKLRDRLAGIILRIGSDAFTRRDLAAVECFNFMAAQNLSNAIRILTSVLPVTPKNTRELFEHVPPTSLALPRVGPFAMAVLGAAFEVKKVGGDTPLTNWYRKHAQKPETFLNLKHREAVEHAAATLAARRTKHARRNTAHRLRVDRFTARQE